MGVLKTGDKIKIIAKNLINDGHEVKIDDNVSSMVVHSLHGTHVYILKIDTDEFMNVQPAMIIEMIEENLKRAEEVNIWQ